MSNAAANGDERLIRGCHVNATELLHAWAPGATRPTAISPAWHSVSIG